MFGADTPESDYKMVGIFSKGEMVGMGSLGIERVVYGL